MDEIHCFMIFITFSIRIMTFGTYRTLEKDYLIVVLTLEQY